MTKSKLLASAAIVASLIGVKVWDNASHPVIHEATNPGYKVSDPSTLHDGVIRIPVTMDGSGVYTVKVDFGTGPVSCIVDSGSADVAVGLDILQPIATQVEVRGHETAVMADGSQRAETEITLPEVKIGDVEQRDVDGSTLPAGAGCLLGETFFHRYDAMALNIHHSWLMLFPYHD